MRWWVLVVLGMAQLMVMLDATVVNIALIAAFLIPNRALAPSEGEPVMAH